MMDESIRVLHADDEPDFAEMAGTFLDREDDRFDVETVTSAIDDLDRLADDEFDCVVSDYDMPGQDGIEFLEAVREEYPDLPFILYTGKGSEEVASDAVSAGVTDYIQKDSGTSQYTILANRIRNAVEQYRSRRAVEETEQKLSELAEKTDDILFMFDSDWTELLFVNSAYEEIWDRSIAELEENPRSFLENVHPDDQILAEETLERILSGKPTEVEHRVRTDEGDVRWIYSEARPIFDEEGTFTRIVGFVRDITARKEYERDLTETTNQFQTVLDTVEAAIFIKDTEGRYQFMNRECRQLLGIDPDEDVTGLTDQDLLPADVADQYYADDQRVIETGETLEIEEEVPSPTGTQINRTLKSPLYDGDGELVGVCAVSTDITDRRERKQELQRERDRLDEFAGVVSHDLRSPLRLAEGRLELTRDECNSEHLAVLDDALTRMDRIIEDVLRLAREGREIGSMDAIALRETVDATWDIVADAADEADLRYADDDRPLPAIEADEGRLQQLLENLLSNAIEHGGPAVTITVGLLNDGFYLEDDGPGVPRDDHEEVFTAGYTTAEAGTGLGLSIVRQVAEAHGWDISVTDGAAGGARFEITGVELAE